jgi:hypothetical protein
MVERIPSVLADGQVDQVDGDLMAADLGSEDAEEMQRVGVIGLGRERLAIARLGLAQPSGLMVRKAGAKGIGRDRHPRLRPGALRLPEPCGSAARFAIQ